MLKSDKIMQLSKDLIQMPSPAMYGSQLSEKIINDGLRLNPSTLAEQLGFLIQTTDFSVLSSTFKQLFSLAKDSASSQKKLQNILTVINLLITKFEEVFEFKNAVIRFFDQLDKFPGDIIARLNVQTAFPLTIHCCSSKFSREAKKLLSETLVKKANNSPRFFISNNSLFELLSLKLENFDPKPLLQHAESPCLFPASELSDTAPKFKDDEIQIPLSAVLNENDQSILQSQRKLQHIFSFYNDFNEQHAGIFLLSLVQPTNKYKAYLESLSIDMRKKVFNDIKNVILSFNIDAMKIIPSLDVPGFAPLSPKSCSLLFQALKPFFDTKPMPASQLTTKWQNKQLQFSLIVFISSHEVEGLDFANSDKKLNVSKLQLQLQNLSKRNNCWISIDFAERALQLAEDDANNMATLFNELCEASPVLVLAVLGQVKVQGKSIDSKAVDALLKLVSRQNAATLYSALWEISSDFTTQVTLKLYHQQPTKIKEIFASASTHLHDLLMNKDVAFATDLAFSASKTQSLGNFMKNYTTRYGSTSLPQIIEIVKKRSSEPIAKAEAYTVAALNDFFDYLQTTFETYSIEIQAIIRNGYEACDSARNGIKPLVFKLKIPQSKLIEIKERASLNFSRLFDGGMTTEEFVKDVEHSATCDPTLFACTIHYLLMELKFLDKHTPATVEILGHLIGLLMISGCLTTKQQNKICDFIKHSISEPERSYKFILACIALNDMVPSLSKYPTFVFDVIRETPLREKDSVLYEKLQKVDQTMNEPLAFNHPKTLTLHPILTKKFENPAPPLDSVAKKLTELRQKPELLSEIIKECSEDKRNDKFSFATLFVASLAMDHPREIIKIAEIANSNPQFAKELFMASAFHAIKIILNPKFDKSEGGIIRRRLVAIGKLIGLVTLAKNRPIISRFIDLKKTLLYAFSQGKLYGVVPFIVSIFSVSSDFFDPPNPYTSSILQILAAIYLTDCIKSSIKQQILFLFSKMGVTISIFAATPHLFPENTKNNFDFLMAPFSLLHFIANSEVERLTAFDESVFQSFVNSYVTVPDSPAFVTNPELREKVRSVIAKQAFTFIKSEGQSLSTTAAGTIIELVKKDLINSEYVKELAKDLTRQVCAGLTLFTAPMRISRQFMNNICAVNELATGDWIEEATTKNYDWISQLLRDVVKARTWAIVQQEIDAIEEKSHKSTIRSKLQTNQNVLQIYSDFSDISLSQQSFPQYEMQQLKEKHIQTNPEFDEYIKGFQELIPFDLSSQHDTGYDDAAVQARIRACPNFSLETPSVERLRSSVKSFLVYLSKVPRHEIEVILCQILERVIASVPKVLIHHIQQYVLSWMRMSIRSNYVIVELIKMGLVVPEELDAMYANSLNSEPFNVKNLCFIAKFIHYAINEVKIIKPHHMVSSLAIISTLTMTQLDFPGSQQYVQVIEALHDIYENMDSEESQLSSGSKLTCIPPFINPPSVKEIQDFKDILEGDEPEEQAILQAAHACAMKGREMFDALFALESEKTIKQVLKCMHENNDINAHLKEALDSLQNIISQKGCVINADIKSEATAILMLISYGCNSSESALMFSNMLHALRPVKYPSFALSWMSIMSNKAFVYQLINESEGWSSYAMLYADFVACVSQIEPTHESFKMIYKALLRLTLVLTHDFPAFMYETAQIALCVAPTRLTQLRNIYFSLQQPANEIARFIIPNRELPQQLTAVLPSIMSTQPFNENQLKIALATLKTGKEPSSDALVDTIIQPLLLQKSPPSVEETATFAALKFSFEQSNYQTDVLLANSLFDRLRQENKESNVVSRVIIALILANLKAADLPVSDVLLRVLAERTSTPAPHPPALITLVRDLFNNNAVWALPCIKTSASTIKFFSSLKQAFAKK